MVIEPTPEQRVRRGGEEFLLRLKGVRQFMPEFTRDQLIELQNLAEESFAEEINELADENSELHDDNHRLEEALDIERDDPEDEEAESE
jgi:hypothetical protein